MIDFLPCPCCGNPLARLAIDSRPVESVRAYACEDCGGFWLGAGTLDRLWKNLVERLDPTPWRQALLAGESESPKSCPDCGAALQTLSGERLPEGLAIDRCPTCSGLWLDPGEMSALKRILRSERYLGLKTDELPPERRSEQPETAPIWRLLALLNMYTG